MRSLKKKKKNSNSNNNYNNNNNQQVVESKRWQIKPQKRVVFDDYEVVHRRQKRGNDCPLLPLFIFTPEAGLEKASNCFRSDHVITYTGCYALEYYVERGQSQ